MAPAKEQQSGSLEAQVLWERVVELALKTQVMRHRLDLDPVRNIYLYTIPPDHLRF